MEFSFSLTAATFLLFASLAAAHEAALGSFNGGEREALFALKSALNNSFLSRNWTGTPCFNNETPFWYGLKCSNGRIAAISLNSLGLAGEIGADAFARFTFLSVLSLKNNSLSGNLFDFSSCPNLEIVDLSFNEFTGPIPISLASLASLQSLHLENNRLSGPIPELNQSSMAEFNVSNNDLTGAIPRSEALRSFGLDSFIGNPRLFRLPYNLPFNTVMKLSNQTSTSPSDSPSSSSTNHITLLLVLVIILFIVSNLLMLLLFIKKRAQLKNVMHQLENHATKERESEKMREISTENNNSTREMAEEGGGGKLIFMEEGEKFQFELGDLLKASAEGLGKGIFGNSYKAMLEGKSAVVVKRLRDLKPLSATEFSSHVEVIAKQRHPNLLPLLAYFYTKNEKLLIYKYAQKGNLFDRIHGGRGVAANANAIASARVPFRWTSRFLVARGVARALQFLHLNSKQNAGAPHGNLKPSNVLLDDNDQVLVSDYGFASLVALPIAAQHMTSYRSPEYQQTKKVSRKSDVWSFGCLLIELLTGKISSHSTPEGSRGVDLYAWVNQAVREEWTAEIFDSELSSQRSAIPGMLNLLQIAIRCSNNSPEKRPEMAEVVMEIESIRMVENVEEYYSSSFDQSLTDDSMSR